ncbi:MAG: hypothetical protein JST74_11045 [Bacteroidetes bacterium]|nr:hypothetical protein [Bacteroidota bacterium]
MTDQVVPDIPSRNKIAVDWNVFNAGQGVVVENAYKDFPSSGLGDPTVDTLGASAYYKWDGSVFKRVGGNDPARYSGASPSTIALGGIPAGTDLTNRTISNIIEQAVVVYLQPAFSAFAIVGQPPFIEVGDSILGGDKNFTWVATNSNNVKPGSIIIRDDSAGTDLVSGLNNDGNAVVNLPNPIQLNEGNAEQVFRIYLQDIHDQLVSSYLVVIALYNRFFGSSLTPPNDSASVRAMNSTFENNFSITIPQGRLVAAFAYEATRPDISDSSVKYVEGFNANVGNTFVKTVLNVNDAGGTTRSYKLYVATLGAPYPSTATYNVTVP